MRGTIKRLLKSKGFGFITDEDGRDRFFHLLDLSSPDKDRVWWNLLEGTAVTFDPVVEQKKLRVRNVEIQL